MAVIYVCPGLSDSEKVHGMDCCAAFARQSQDRKQEIGWKLPAPEVPAELTVLRPEAVALLAAAAAGRVWWVIQRSGTYGHVEGRRCTKLLRALAGYGAVQLPTSSGVCLPTGVGLAALVRYPEGEGVAER